MPKRRNYRSDQRDTAAEATRTRILDAAHAHFTRDGIDKVTIARIAATAGVAASTVYALFKSKEGVLRALITRSLFGPRVAQAQALLDQVDDAPRLIALTARVARLIYESESLELGLLRGASSFSPMLRQLEQEFEDLRYRMQETRIRLLFAQGKAKPGLDIETARRILWMYTSRDLYRMLVEDGGWSPGRYQDWLATTLVDALVDPSARS